ncbi:DEAD/DEAH box helicase family protein [Bacteroides sp. GD17]|jgi:hypothetical protein|uniref:DEAD/DEAH box helicase family protein n=1 Tax=Bacteroides sp. GD17 TaxID=3139826 RepID=UPI0025D91C67|nr:DEAD/DEAH box helicase family protein [uncultured Bacteroides sp.]
MRRELISIPEGIKYLTDLDEFELPNGVCNKKIPGCGATTVALIDNHKTIICSPRNELLKNKHAQYSNSLLVVGGVYQDEIDRYIQDTDIPKILVSYDSMYKLIGCIKDKSEWRVVVDEFQCLLSDSSFKSETEFHFLNHLKAFPYITYLSATPILDKYLEQIDFFNDIPYYELQWKEIETVQLIRYKNPKPINIAINIVRMYQAKNYPSIVIDNKVHQSIECVIFLNSVTNILNIIKHTELRPEDVNIIVGSTDDNDKLIKKIGAGFSRGRIPLKGEPHKQFTFCTSTAYAGCDFYSESAASFVISDCTRINTSIDISTDLVQIAGRQRLDSNPFRKYLTFIYNTSVEEISGIEFYQALEGKVAVTNMEVKSNNNEAEPLKQKRIKDWNKMPMSLRYQDSYTMYDEHSQQFVFNRLAYVNEQFCFDLQKHNYQNGIIIRKQLDDNHFDTSVNQEYISYQEQLKHLIKKEDFSERMKYYCEYKDKGNLILDVYANTLQSKYPELEYYYNTLGSSRIKALSYKECNLKNEISIMNSKSRILYELGKVIKRGERITNPALKALLQSIYDKLRFKKTAHATDILEYFPDSLSGQKVVTPEGRRNGWEIR